MHQKNVITKGVDIHRAKKALILLHGRGADANDILSLADWFKTDDFVLLAPQATGNSWYPYSFLSVPAQNEPWLSSALDLVGEVVAEVEQYGIAKDRIYFAGFSQGACLTLEYVARHAVHYGGVAAFTGGLIGDKVYPENYKGNFAGTRIFIGSSDPDMHVPVERVHETTDVLQVLGANVTEKIYPGMGHTISQDELRLANGLIFS